MHTRFTVLQCKSREIESCIDGAQTQVPAGQAGGRRAQLSTRQWHHSWDAAGQRTPGRTSAEAVDGGRSGGTQLLCRIPQQNSSAGPRREYTAS